MPIKGCETLQFRQQVHIFNMTHIMYLSGQNEKGLQQDDESEKAFAKTKEYVWHQNKD